MILGGINMSKIFSRALMIAYMDMEDDMLNQRLSPEDEQIWSNIGIRLNDIARHINDLGQNFNSLNRNQLAELKELEETQKEFDEIKAERMTAEKRQTIIDNLSTREEKLPLSGKIWLETLRKFQEPAKTQSAKGR